MIRFVFTALFVGAFIWFGATVNLGKRTLFGHIGNIWSSDEAQEMREDVKETTAPVIDKAKRGAERGWKAVKTGDEADLDGGRSDNSGPSTDPGKLAPLLPPDDAGAASPTP